MDLATQGTNLIRNFVTSVEARLILDDVVQRSVYAQDSLAGMTIFWEIFMILFRLYDVGRTWLLRLCSPLTGGPDVLEIRAAMEHRGAKSLVVDTTAAEYADSNGLRWLLALHQTLTTHGMVVRILASKNSKVLRNLELLGGAFDVTTDARNAWYRKPWRKAQFKHSQRLVATA